MILKEIIFSLEVINIIDLKLMKKLLLILLCVPLMNFGQILDGIGCETFLLELCEIKYSETGTICCRKHSQIEQCHDPD